MVPTGYSFNLDGTNIYMTLAALFIAQATNTELTLGHQITLLLVAMLSSKGAAGVTGAGFITLAATLSVVPEVPVAGMALILGVDRFMSECRSLTNFTGNAVATIVVSRWENALDRDKLNAALDGSWSPIRTACRSPRKALPRQMPQEAGPTSPASCVPEASDRAARARFPPVGPPTAATAGPLRIGALESNPHRRCPPRRCPKKNSSRPRWITTASRPPGRSRSSPPSR